LALSNRRFCRYTARPFKAEPVLLVVAVGASLLAMDVNDNAGIQNERVAFEFIASKLAPTVT
jgi:hypothetical protein